MAIVIEEEKGGVSFGLILGWVVILGIIVIAVYYIFFKSPELLDSTLNSGIDIGPIGNIVDVDPQAIIRDPGFSARHELIAQPTAGTTGRANPFAPL